MQSLTVRARLIVLIALPAAAWGWAAADEPLNRASLRDLEGVRVGIEDLPPNAEGLTKDKLREAAEGQLRTARIPVLNAGEFPVGDPGLYVRVTISPAANGLVACLVELDFQQIVFLRRSPAVTFNRARTWAAASQVRLVTSAALAESVKRSLSEQVAEFITAYFAANPK